jgi:hypothetical protein
MFCPQEAWVSGSAGISILEEGLYYSYQEHGRKILSADDYEDYFARKRKAMLGALAYSQLRNFNHGASQSRRPAWKLRMLRFFEPTKTILCFRQFR